MKKFFLFLLGLIGLLAIVALVFLLTFDLNSYRTYITEKVSETLGRPVSIGHLDMKLSMIPTIKIQDIQVSNPENFTEEKPFVSIDSAEATLAIAPLFSKLAEIQNIKANTVHVNLLQNGSRNNWMLIPQKQKNQPKIKQQQEWQVRIDAISAQRVSVNYENANQVYQWNLSDLSLKQLKALSMTTTWNEKRFKVTATIDDLLKLLRQEPNYSFNAEISGMGANVKLSGSIGDTVSFKKLLLNADITGGSLKHVLGAFAIDHKAIPVQPFALRSVLQGDISKFDVTKLDLSLGGNKLKAEFVGTVESLTYQPTVEMKGKITLADLTLGQFWGLQPFTADLDFNVSQTGLNLKQLSYLAGRSDLQLSGKWGHTQDRPEVALNIVSEYLSLQDILQENEGPYQVQPTEQHKKNWALPDKPISLDFLKTFNGVFAISVPHWQVSDKIVGYFGEKGTITVKNGVLATKDFRLNILDGDIVADVVIDSNNGQQFDLKMKGDHLDLNNLKSLNDVLKDSQMDFKVNVTANGETLHKVITSLNGDLEVEIPQGLIVDEFFNNNIIETLGGRKKRSVTSTTTDQFNELLCGVIKVQIQNGEIQAQNNIALETPHVGFLIGGRIRLVDFWVSLSMNPIIYNTEQVVLDKISNAAIRSVRIIGNLPNIKPEPDTTGVLGGLLDARTFKTYQTCAAVLGRKPKAQVQAEAKKLEMLPEPTVVEVTAEQPETPQEQFKKQLLESLTKVAP